MNPVFHHPSGHFYGTKINYLWQIHRCLDCHFCQATCEQKHFSTAVILAMDLPNQGPMQRNVSTHTKANTQLHPMTDKKCKVHTMPFPKKTTLLHSACNLWGNSHVKWQTSNLLSSWLNRLPSLASSHGGKWQGLRISCFYAMQQDALKWFHEIICSRLIVLKIKWRV